ncbi:hypothetical protein V9T40_011601 [Parthenolecanium corni]|uniref:Carboxypeptidase n=1 Tax=Parthenolecanium corni TaxID=536013 RepID=A0AAN9T6B9_9HEMI
MVLPFLIPHTLHKVPPEITPDSENVGEPLILTPYLKSNQNSKARKLSDVEPLLKGIVSNSGYFTVNETYNSNLFFWFFRKTSDDWKEAPLLLWLQGGPGCSSLIGLFEENGPFRLVKNVLKRRKFSWTNDYNVIYIDQPVGSGYSFTNSSKGRIHNQEQVADHLYEALTQFFLLYPELKDNPFYVSGESYAGKYVPAIAYKIHTLKKAGKSSINLKGLFLVSATTDGIGMMEYIGDVCYHIGIIDSRIRDQTKFMFEDLKSYVHSRLWTNASFERVKILYNIYAHTRVSLHDCTKSIDDPIDDASIKYLQSSKIRKKIHAGGVKYSVCSNEVYEDFSDDILKSVKPWVEELLEHYPVAFVGGQYDLIVAYLSNANVLKRLEWSGAFKFGKAVREKLIDQKKVVGYYKSVGNLKDVMIRRAGHAIPMDQPKIVLDVLKKFVSNKL